MKNWKLFLLAGWILFLMRPAHADWERGVAPASATQVKPVNVPPTPFKTVTATVTVRLNGVLTDAQQVSYIFAPGFLGNSDSLPRIDLGTFFLRSDNVPVDKAYVVTLSAVYDDSVVGRDGAIERRGRTYTGTLRINVPYSEETNDLGVLFIDLR